MPNGKKKAVFVSFSCLISAAVFLSPFVPPDEYYIAGFLALTIPICTGWNVVLLMWLWLWKTTRWAWGPAVILILAIPLLSLSFSIRKHDPILHGFKLLTYNVGAFHYYLYDGKYPQYSGEFKSWAEKSGFNVICLQETVELQTDSVKLEGYQVLSSLKTAKDGNHLGLFIFSNLPVVDHGELEFAFNSFNRLMWADVVYGSDTIRVMNVHLVSYDFYEKSIRQNFYKMKNSLKARSWHSKLIRKFIEESPYPAVLCGDFNEVSQSYPYHNLTRVLDDTYKRSGIFYGKSFDFHGVPIRIDHVLIDERLTYSDYEILNELPWSDHSPISIRIGLPGRDERTPR